MVWLAMPARSGDDLDDSGFSGSFRAIELSEGFRNWFGDTAFCIEDGGLAHSVMAVMLMN